MFGGGVGRVVQSIDTAGNRLVSDCIVRASLGVPLIGFSPIFAGRMRLWLPGMFIDWSHVPYRWL